MPKAKVGDIHLYYEEHGQGAPLLLIMGLGASTLSWSEQIPVFGREFRVVAFDNRGAGRSDKPAVRYNIALFADDTAGLMDALSTLVLGSTSCGGRHAVAASPENLAGIGMMNVLSPREAAEKGLPLLYSEEFIARHHDALIQRSLRESELRPPFEAFGRQIQAAVRHNTFDRLPDIRCPTLVITGDDDKVVPADNSRILAERIPAAELAVLPGAGHGYLVEKAAESNAIVLEFLRRHRAVATELAALPRKGSNAG
jgi:pimeloyl-ACP methyl ester carboxylesterase